MSLLIGRAFRAVLTLVSRTFYHLQKIAMVDSLVPILLFLASPLADATKQFLPPNQESANSGAAIRPERGAQLSAKRKDFSRVGIGTQRAEL